jgi:hypothetical protein
MGIGLVVFDQRRIIMDSEVNAHVFRLNQEISQLNKKIDFILHYLNLTYVDDSVEFPPELLDALRSGNKNKAVSLYRQMTNCDLRLAVEKIEELMGQG